MNHRSLLVLILMLLLLLGSCIREQTEAAYFGNWVNIYLEVYSYETGSTNIITEDTWPQKRVLPTTIHLEKRNKYSQLTRSKSGKILSNNSGKWTIDNQDSITIETDHFLFNGKVILVDNELSLEGIQYTLDENRAILKEKAVERKSIFRKIPSR